jgi:hypothetical protein
MSIISFGHTAIWRHRNDKKCTVLVVENDLRAQKLAKLILDDDYEILVAPEGAVYTLGLGPLTWSRWRE